MKFCTILAVIVALVTIVGTSQGAQIVLPPTQVQIAAHLFTAPVLEPNGSIAVCFATNLDSVARDLEARIIDSAGVEVTQTSSCGARLGSGATCESTAHFGQQFSIALCGGDERRCHDASWSVDDFDKRCVPVHRPGNSECAGRVSSKYRLNKF